MSLFKPWYVWCSDHAPWLIGRKCAAATLNLRGSESNESEDYQTAIMLLSRGIEMYPGWAMLWHNRGYSYHQLGRYDEALSDFDEALRREPAHGESLSFRASSLGALGRYEEAMVEFARAETRVADPIYVHTRRGMLYLQLKKWAEALADFNHACALQPDYALCHNNRGYALFKLGRFREAKAEWDRALQLNPEFPFTMKNLAWLEATCPDDRFRNGSRAVKHAERAMELGGGDVPHWLPVLAAACAEAGDFDRAIKYAESALEVTEGQDHCEIRSQLQMYRERRACRDRDIVVWCA